MKKPMLEQVIRLSIPFAVIFSDSPLGSDVFVAILDTDYRTHRLTGFEQGDDDRVRTRALNDSEVSAFNGIRQHWTRHDLGLSGSAYELPGRSLHETWQQMKRTAKTTKPAHALTR